jgi:hypothetical protein
LLICHCFESREIVRLIFCISCFLLSKILDLPKDNKQKKKIFSQVALESFSHFFEWISITDNRRQHHLLKQYSGESSISERRLLDRWGTHFWVIERDEFDMPNDHKVMLMECKHCRRNTPSKLDTRKDSFPFFFFFLK